MQSLRDEMSSPPPESPTGSPSREDNPASSRQPSPSLPRTSPTLSQPPTHSRKRGSEDLSQFVQNIGRQMKLRKVDQEVLEKVASVCNDGVQLNQAGITI